jgi:hypothetical protein
MSLRGFKCGKCLPCLKPHWKKPCQDKKAPSDEIVPKRKSRTKNDKVDVAVVEASELHELACLLKMDASAFKIRRIDGQYVLLDVAMVLTGYGKKSCQEQLRDIIGKYPHAAEKFRSVALPGRGREVLHTADIEGIVEVVMLLPGKRPAQVRTEAARVLVRCLGGDISLAEEVISNRERQDALRVNDPEHAARAFGENVEAAVGSTDEQRKRFERHLQKSSRRVTKYDPAKLSEVHHAFKDECNTDLLRGVKSVFGSAEAMANGGYAVILDDVDAEGRLRTTTALLEAGFPVDRILAPNKEASVVEKLLEVGVKSVQKHLREALGSDFVGLNLSLAYLDSTSGDITEIRGMLKQVQANQKGPLVVAYTLCLRCFTPGGAMSFTERILNLLDYMRSCGFEPLHQTFENSYKEYRDCAQMVATCFWKRAS